MRQSVYGIFFFMFLRIVFHFAVVMWLSKISLSRLETSTVTSDLLTWPDDTFFSSTGSGNRKRNFVMHFSRTATKNLYCYFASAVLHVKCKATIFLFYIRVPKVEADIFFKVKYGETI